jgi:hypothetical protein
MEILSITCGEMSTHLSNMDIHFGVNEMLVKISNVYWIKMNSSLKYCQNAKCKSKFQNSLLVKCKSKCES